MHITFGMRQIVSFAARGFAFTRIVTSGNRGGVRLDCLIKNGVIITASDTYEADIRICNGKITEIGVNLESNESRAVDAAGMYVLPGAVDAHVHLELPVAGTVSADDYESGTRAAACGGVTTIFDFAQQTKGKGLLDDAREQVAKMSRKACIDFALHAAITDTSRITKESLLESAGFGITSFKMYMVYKDIMVTDGDLFDMLALSQETGMLMAVHAENPSIIDKRIQRFLREGKTGAWHHYESRPEFVEAEAIKRAVYLAKAAGAPLYIVHLACKEGLAEIRRARLEGQTIYAETCPQYLNFSNDVYKRPDGRNFVCSPPIKGLDSRDALWEGIIRGDISTVATDHCPFKSYEKDWGKDDFTKTPNGCMGTETMYSYMLSAANKGRITFQRAVELCAANPARIFGIAPQKGAVTVGSDADLVLYDPNADYVVRQENMHSNTDYTIWEGCQIKGTVVMTISRGEIVFDHGKFTGAPGRGRFVRCRKS
jgi:dihydropyrimidinase